ncbi:MAG: agmatinase [Thermoanaerobaculia bacterium]
MIPFLNVERPGNFKWVIVPVPYEKTTSYIKGTSRAPEEILKATSYVELYDQITEREAYKEIGIETDLDWKYKKLDLNKIEERVSFWLGKRKKVLALGGEHTITLSCIRAYKKYYKNFGIVHFDAHSDLRDSYENSKYSHACVMRRIFEENIPFVSLGIRALSLEEADFIKRNKIGVIFAHDFSLKKLEKFLKDLPKKIYISFDCDFLDPKEVPALGTPEPGGFCYYETLKIIEVLSKQKEIIGMDFVEATPLKNLEYGIYTLARLLYQIIIFSEGIYAKHKGNCSKIHN